MQDKYQLLDGMVAQLERLADARGVERAAIIVDLWQKARALIAGLRDEDDAHAARVKLLEDQLDALTQPPETAEGEESYGGETYTIGEGSEDAEH